MPEPRRPAVSRQIIDNLVDYCREGEAQWDPERVKAGRWRGSEDPLPWQPRGSEVEALLTKLGWRERAVLAKMLEKAAVSGVFYTLRELQQHEIKPFEDGYEGGPIQDFIGRMDEWEWPEEL